MVFTADRIILLIFGITFVLGGIDFLLGNKFGCGKKFHEGLQTFAPLFLTMAGFIVLTPVIVRIISPVIVPLFQKMGMDPGVFPGIILACDNGAYTLSQELGKAPQAAESRRRARARRDDSAHKRWRYPHADSPRASGVPSVRHRCTS